MPPSPKISAFIIARNEADRIPAAIASVRMLVDEVVVIDSGSTDGTPDVCRDMGARVVFNEWKGYGAQKRFGEDQCRNDWILNLDADEVLTPELDEEIRALFRDGEPEVRCYALRVFAVYPLRKEPTWAAAPTLTVRFYDKRIARFSGHPAWDHVDTGSHAVATLKGRLLHFSARSIEHVIEKMNAYTSLQANAIERQSLALMKLRLWFEFPAALFKSLILRRQLFEGIDGFVYGMMRAFFRFIRLAKMIERAEKDRRPPPDRSS